MIPSAAWEHPSQPTVLLLEAAPEQPSQPMVQELVPGFVVAPVPVLTSLELPKFEWMRTMTKTPSTA